MCELNERLRLDGIYIEEIKVQRALEFLSEEEQNLFHKEEKRRYSLNEKYWQKLKEKILNICILFKVINNEAVPIFRGIKRENLQFSIRCAKIFILICEKADKTRSPLFGNDKEWYEQEVSEKTSLEFFRDFLKGMVIVFKEDKILRRIISPLEISNQIQFILYSYGFLDGELHRDYFKDLPKFDPKYSQYMEDIIRVISERDDIVLKIFHKESTYEKMKNEKDEDLRKVERATKTYVTLMSDISIKVLELHPSRIFLLENYGIKTIGEILKDTPNFEKLDRKIRIEIKHSVKNFFDCGLRPDLLDEKNEQ